MRFIYRADGTSYEVGQDSTPSSCHHIMPDIAPYRSMVTGEMIGGRSQHREHMRAHQLVEIGNETKYLQPKPKQVPAGLKQMIAEIANAKLR